jgi:hypothetical protein
MQKLNVNNRYYTKLHFIMRLDKPKVHTHDIPTEIKLYDEKYRPHHFDVYEPDKEMVHNSSKEIGKYTIPADIIPKMIPITFTCILKDTLPCYVNGLRRVILSELESKAFDIVAGTYNTNDVFINESKVSDALRSIPLMQSKVRENMRFELNVKNTDKASVGTVYTRHIKHEGKSVVDLGICDNMELFTIYPSTMICMHLYIRVASGVVCGQHSTCYNAAMKKVAKSPNELSTYKDHKEKVLGKSNPNEDSLHTLIGRENLIRDREISVDYIEDTEFYFSASTSGHIHPIEAIIKSIDNITTRYDKVAELLEKSVSDVSDDGLHILTIYESHTLIEPIVIELTYGANKDRITFVSQHKSPEPFIKLSIRLAEDSTTENVLALLNETIDICRERFLIEGIKDLKY